MKKSTIPGFNAASSLYGTYVRYQFRTGETGTPGRQDIIPQVEIDCKRISIPIPCGPPILGFPPPTCPIEVNQCCFYTDSGILAGCKLGPVVATEATTIATM